MTGGRLEKGGVIDRAHKLSFTWDGVQMSGFAGDTLASAMMANGVDIAGRSFKYHRPRGIQTAGPEEGGALVTVGQGARREANAKATQIELHDGLAAFGQNAWPNVRFDLGQVNNLFNRFFAAGFYYKTFMGLGRGTWEWMQFEKIIRRAAGMGSASREADPDQYDIVHDFCDLLVVGSGPTGLAAAELAAANGLDVILAEQDFALGGRVIGSGTQIEGKTSPGWLAAKIEALSKVRILRRTTAFGLYDTNVVALYEKINDMPTDGVTPRGAVRLVRPQRVILATGAIERPFAFGNNDRPGVMLADAMARYVERFGAAPGKTALLATNNDSTYLTAITLAKAGLNTTLLDAREVPPAGLLAAAQKAGIRQFSGFVPIETEGGSAVTAVKIGRRGADGTQPDRSLACDCVGISGGWSPAIHLVSHRGVKPVWNSELACFTSGTPPEGVDLAGAANAYWTTDACIADGQRAATEAVRALTKKRPKAPPVPAPGGDEAATEPLWEVTVKGRKLKSFIDPQHDVTTDDVRLAAHEGYVSVEHMKRYTTLGMATDQGKLGNVVGLALLADSLGQTIPETGITTFRPPYTPIPMGASAGRARDAHWQAIRRTPMHAVQEDGGAVFTDAGLWKRAWFHPRTETETLGDAYIREATLVREAVGMVDVTTLGKIAVQGPDAAEFLNRVYVNGFGKLPVMKTRYGVNLRDDGIVFDDGVTWRLAEDEFLVTCTTAHAAQMMVWLEYLLALRWPELRVNVASTTDQWAGVAVAGPKARKALEATLASGDVSNDGLPFMGICRAKLTVEGGEIDVLIARISFSGELAFEIYTKSDFGPAMWTALKTQVVAQGGAPYGMEALGALRIEKGHVTGAELDGRVTLEDAGLGKMASTKKPFIGMTLRKRPDLTRADRPQLVHFHPVDEADTFKIGAVVCEPGKVQGHGIGWITGVTVAPALGGGWLGIGFVSGGVSAWEGKEVVIADPVRGMECRARVTSPHQYDPKGERMHG